MRLELSLRQSLQRRFVGDRYEAMVDRQVACAAPVDKILVDAFARDADQVADLLLRQLDVEPQAASLVLAECSGQSQQATRYTRWGIAQQRVFQRLAGLPQAL